MRFRYKSGRGKVVTLSDVASLLEAIRTGTITPETLLSVGDDRRWHPAGEVAAYREAVEGLERSGTLARRPSILSAVTTARTLDAEARTAEQAPKAGPSWLRRLRGRGIALLLLGALAVALAAFRLRAMTRASERALATAAAAPIVAAPAASERARALATAYGDSIAVGQLRLQEWVSRQRFEARFHGAQLRSVPALRGVRAGVTRWRRELDSLQARTAALGARLLAEAAALEETGERYDGLVLELADSVRAWEKDLAGYLEMERRAALAVDSTAQFLLGRQASFGMVDGEPVFLSRADAARFRELLARPAQVAAEEKAWAEQVQRKRPGWMAALLEGERPLFGEPLLPGP